ncbi:MAG: YtxH domain-containing protein [Chloroflexota bacterium]|jgi:gas vesicle protein
MTSFVRFLVGFISGAMIGAVLATLLAPASGEELRSQFKERAVNLQSEVSQAASQRRDELKAQLDALRSN